MVYFKLDNIRDYLKKESTSRLARKIVQKSCTSFALFSLVLAGLSCFWPWFAVQLGPTEKLQVLNETVNQMDMYLDDILNEIRAAIRQADEIEQLGSCEAIITVSTLALITGPIFGPAAKPLLQGFRVISFVKGFLGKAGEYRHQVLAMRDSIHDVANHLDEFKQPLLFGVSVYNIGMVS